MKFAHLADCHLGGWRDPRMRDLNSKAFEKTIDLCVSREVDFVLICGDLYNTALPGIEIVRDSIRILNKLKKNNIPVYMIAGSHDYSPSGKTMLSVLEEAGLVKNVAVGSSDDEKLKLEVFSDSKTGAKMCGIIGKRGALEESYYKFLDREHLQSVEGFKIFLFHSAILELKERGFEEMLAMPLSMLPKGFNYYAGGHVHTVCNRSVEGYENIVYPGPLFPNSFSEIEELKGGGFFIYDNGEIIREDIRVKPVISIKVESKGHSAEDLSAMLRAELVSKDVSGAIITLRLKGALGTGKISDIDFSTIFSELYDRGAYFVMRNTSGLDSQVFEAVRVEEENIDVLEKTLVREHAGQDKRLGLEVEKEIELGLDLLNALSSEKHEGETKSTYEERMRENAKVVLEKHVDFGDKNE